MIFPLKMTIFPLKNVDFPIKNCDVHLKMTIFPSKMMNFPLKIVIFPLKKCDFPIKNCDVPSFFVCLPKGIQIFQNHRMKSRHSTGFFGSRLSYEAVHRIFLTTPGSPPRHRAVSSFWCGFFSPSFRGFSNHHKSHRQLYLGEIMLPSGKLT